MKKIIQESGFWMMVFAVVIIALFLSTGEGKCDTEVMVEQSTDKEVVVALTDDDDKERPNMESVRSEGEAAVFMLLVIPRPFRQLRAGGM